MKLFLSVFLLLSAMPAIARVRAVSHRQSILWIGAHPDDEALLAPLLASDGQASILVMTHGERGNCVLPGGCGSNLGAVRAAEMARAAELLHAHLTLWSFSDVGVDVDATWSAEAGTHAELIRRIESVIAAEKATIVYTFDPNHGSTCHPAHRAVGALAMEAAAQIGIRVMFLETKVDVSGNRFAFHAATPDAIPFDVSLMWTWLVRDAEMHASQFNTARITALQNIPAVQRRVWLSAIPAPVDLCRALPNSSISIHDSLE